MKNVNIMNKVIRYMMLWVMLLYVGPLFAQQELRLPSTLGSNMVVQQNARLNVWGWSAPDARITVEASWARKPIKTSANGKGEWSVSLKTPAASYDEQSIIVTSGHEQVSMTNVLVGEVWLCSGQSNMAWTVAQTLDLKADLRKKSDKNRYIRLFNTGSIFAGEPQDDIEKVSWTTCNPESLGKFSAVGYAFGRKLQEELGVPVGLIDASYGGTVIEGWIPIETLEESPRSYWLMRSVGIINRSKSKWRNKQSQLYNANIHPLRNMSIAGVAWYQGCSNVGYNPVSYKESLSALIESWRERFHNAAMPFYVVQIVPHTYPNIKGANLRECQDYVARMTDHVELVVTNDCQDIPGDIHPRYKKTIGERLAACALGEHYGRTNVIYRSPSYYDVKFDGRKAQVTFDDVPTYLKCNGNKILGFQIGQMKDEKHIEFFLADAEFDAVRRSITVSSPKVTAPVAVRYCFDEEVGNVFSAEGLPLAPFRTDNDNFSYSARGYVEPPVATPIRFEGSGYEKVKFTDGSRLWTDRIYILAEGHYPAEFEGYEMLISTGIDLNNKEKTRGGKITALADGRIYCLTRVNNAMLKAARFGWRIILPATIEGARPVGTDENGNPKYAMLESTYIAYKDVVAGQQVELPVSDSWYSIMPLASSIEYVDVSEKTEGQDND